jgi:hypothetical protein
MTGTACGSPARLLNFTRAQAFDRTAVMAAGGFVLPVRASEWVVEQGWTDPDPQRLHGICLRSSEYALVLHIRRLPTVPDLSEAV